MSSSNSTGVQQQRERFLSEHLTTKAMTYILLSLRLWKLWNIRLYPLSL